LKELKEYIYILYGWWAYHIHYIYIYIHITLLMNNRRDEAIVDVGLSPGPIETMRINSPHEQQEGWGNCGCGDSSPGPIDTMRINSPHEQ